MIDIVIRILPIKVEYITSKYPGEVILKKDGTSSYRLLDKKGNYVGYTYSGRDIFLDKDDAIEAWNARVMEELDRLMAFKERKEKAIKALLIN